MSQTRTIEIIKVVLGLDIPDSLKVRWVNEYLSSDIFERQEIKVLKIQATEDIPFKEFKKLLKSIDWGKIEIGDKFEL